MATQEEIERRWSLLIKRYPTDEEIAELLAHSDEIGSHLHSVWSGFPHRWEAVQRYRARKKELDKVSTEELQAMMERFRASRAQAVADDLDDDLDDSFFEAPPIDSDEHIVYELLGEWEKAASAAAT
ncbi:MAG: hypothetical protein V2A55_01925 [Candidatus Jorgensenbacteria bacterium]